MEAALAEADAAEEIYVWPDMAAAVALFFGMQTQWCWVGIGMAGAIRTGLNYAALPIVAGAVEAAVTPDVLADLRTMETSALDQWAKK